uniref:Bile acid-CoA:amino acid N-acyltransferase n=1 Tax=Phallusia mammillata TaxID=59560 RepID=A0A6F9D6N2_9ASCI|nr:bile acid-CoA:amino acid N-acyltransferase [Phallusia mammillata]
MLNLHLAMEKHNPKILCSQIDSMSDDPVLIKIEGLHPEKTYTLHSFAKPSSDLFECVVNYKADSQGVIDLDKSEATNGNYTGVEPMGIFWSMKPSPTNKNKYPRFAKLDVTTPLEVTLCIYDCEITFEQFQTMRTEKTLDKHKVASTVINRWYMKPGTKRIKLSVKKHGVCGTLFIPSGKGPFPAVITMFGSHPGTMEYKASLLASHGFAALALAYFGAPGLPKLFLSVTEEWTLKLEYFENAVKYLLNHEKVDAPSGVGVMVLSFSGFIGFAMATFIPEVKCLILQNAVTHPAYVNLTYKGMTFAPENWEMSEDFEPNSDSSVLRGLCQFFKSSYSLTAPGPEDLAMKFYDRKDVAYMFIASLDDENTPSEHYANRTQKLLQLAKHPNYVILRYPGAGHLLEPPYIVHHRSSVLKGTVGVESLLCWGGVALPHCKAQEDAWKKQIQFLRNNLVHCVKM